MIIDIISVIFIIFGLIFFTGACVGILRLPDFYTRMHAAGKLDSMGILCTIIGVCIFILKNPILDNILLSLKIFLIAVFLY